MSRRTGDDRGQLVLLSGAVVAVALLTLVVVHAQLAYVGGSSDLDVADVADEADRAVTAAATSVAGRYDWPAREAAVDDFRSELDPSLARIERAHTGDGGLVLSTNDSAAAGWALRHCPTGPSRDFGPCVSDGGVVVQERAGETSVVAVVLDVRVGTPTSRADLTLAVRPV